jgi:hypothetical protein
MQLDLRDLGGFADWQRPFLLRVDHPAEASSSR